MTEQNKQAALNVVKRLHEAGFQALWAGGCVRDMLMAVEAQDYDVATNATPKQVSGLFKRTLQVGAQFGVVVVLLDKAQVEVATFRNDGGYVDGRRPEAVEFTDARQDALRRDFTINGMFYDPLTQEVLDYVGGQSDLAAGVIRAIGEPQARFGEDHLRMLRAIRFAARLGYEIEPKTWQAICQLSERISRISSERIATELEKIMVNGNRYAGMKMVLASGLMGHIYGNCPMEQLSEGIERLKLLSEPVDFALALTATLSGGLEGEVSGITRSLKVSNDTRKKAMWLADSVSKLLNSLPLSKGRLKQWLANEWFCDLLNLTWACHTREGKDTHLLEQLRHQIADLGDEEIKPVPLLNGNDLISMGLEPGPKLGQLFEQMYLAQLEGELMTQDQARQWVSERVRRI